MIDVETGPVPADVAATIDALAPGRGIWIDGAGHASAGGSTFEVEDPSTLASLAHVADGGAQEASAAVDAAEAALPAWRGLSPRERSETLRRTFDLMIEDGESLARLMACENGKSVADARSEVRYAAEFFRWFAEEAVRTEGDYGPAPGGGARTLVTHHPVGVAALVTPWNFPAAMVARKIAPALAAGCTVVLKPPHETPLTALALAHLIQRAGVPDGVVNIVPTTRPSEVVTTWLEDPRVRKISFTGSTQVGKALLRQASDRVVNASMELGGNAPFVVTAGADVESAVAGALIAKFRNAGQACTAANRFYVHADVAEAFVDGLSAGVRRLRVGSQLEDDTDIGPLVSSKAAADVRRWIAEAVQGGGVVVAEGVLPDGALGHYVAPTVVVGMDPASPLLQEEIFGPVAPIVTWTDEAQMLGAVNGAEAGLAAYVYADDLQHAIRLGEGIEAGMVGVNRGVVSDPSAPFGGFKQSGLGREGAREGLREFQETQYLSVDWT